MGAQPGTQIGSPEIREAAPSPSQGQEAEAESLRPGLSPPHPEDLTEHPASPRESCGRQTHLLRKVGYMQVSGSIVKLGRIPGSAPRGTETEVAFHATGDPASRVGGVCPIAKGGHRRRSRSCSKNDPLLQTPHCFLSHQLTEFSFTF